MPSPFPGMDPYLEHPALWPDVHNSVLAALRDALAPLVAPRYYVGLERRTYLRSPDDLVLIGVADVAVLQSGRPEPGWAAAPAPAAAIEVDVPIEEEVVSCSRRSTSSWESAARPTSRSACRCSGHR